MHFSETQSIFPRQGNTAVVTCPQCGISQTVQVDRLRARRGPVKVQCSCGPVFGVLVELRQTWREKVHLEGQYSTGRSHEKGGPMVVENVSRHGLGFSSLSRHHLKKDDTLHVAFTLDDSAHSVIEKEVIVKFVRDTFVGCEFADKKNTDEALSSYLNAKHK